jgi:hypothetical protein
MTYPSDVNPYEVERLLHHMPAVAANAGNDFARGFAVSIAKQSRRKGWWPSHKQLPVMRSLVSDLFVHGLADDEGGDFDLIES